MFRLKRQFVPDVTLIVKFTAVLMILILTASNQLFATEKKYLSVAEANAFYTIEMSRQLIWPNEELLQHFKVGILGSYPELNNAFARESQQKVRGKGFQFEEINSTDFAADRYSIIFITRNKRSMNNRILNYVKNALIITEGRVDQKERMISFVNKKRKMDISINLQNLSQRGFDVSTELLKLAGTKEDMIDELMDKDSELVELVDLITEKEVKLHHLNMMMDKSAEKLKVIQEQLNADHNKLIKTNEKIQLMTKEIRNSEEKFNQNQIIISQQEIVLTLKQQTISENEIKVAKQQLIYENNKKILEQQTSSMQRQLKIIQGKEKTIEDQRGYMLIILLVSITFLIMLYFLFRINQQRTKSNHELKKLNSQLYQLATTDGMTKLLNRRCFIESAQRELLRNKRRESQSILLMIDIDHFKKINDTYGHAVGDTVIIAVADTLTAKMRQYDLVGRWGGEEYVMMLVDCNQKSASYIAERLCRQVADIEFSANKSSFKVTISIGLSQIDSDDSEVEQTINRADIALYRAKANGRDRFEYFSEVS